MKKALLVRLSSLGDVVLTSVLIDPLRRNGYTPFLLTFRPYDGLFEDDGRIELLPTDKRELLSQRFLNRLKNYRFDLFVDLHKNLRTFLLRVRLGGRWLSYPKESLRRRLAVRFRRFRKPYSVTESYLKALGGIGRGASPLPRISLSEERLERLREFLPREFIALGPGARYRKKRYPYFRQLSELFIEKGFEVVWVGDREDGKNLGDVRGINLCGKLGLCDLLGVLKLSSVFVGNDSGILHCARAVGTPAVQIYGGTHPTLGFALYPQEGVTVFKDLPCQPCDIHGKGRCKFGDYRCLDIEPDLILTHALGLLTAKIKLRRVEP